MPSYFGLFYVRRCPVYPDNGCLTRISLSYSSIRGPWTTLPCSFLSGNGPYDWYCIDLVQVPVNSFFFSVLFCLFKAILLFIIFTLFRILNYCQFLLKSLLYLYSFPVYISCFIWEVILFLLSSDYSLLLFFLISDSSILLFVTSSWFVSSLVAINV